MLRWSSGLAALALGVEAISPQAHAQEQEHHRAQAQQQDASRPALALMGTVPIYWGEAAGLDEMLSGDVPPHWVRGVLEEDFILAPLDYLSDEVLGGYRYLLMAQPRGLTPQENVALDRWVRDGGTLLLFADPMMTGESRFHLGDRRRPQDVALLSPILSHWGLALQFDPGQPAGQQLVNHSGAALPVNLRGQLGRAGDAQYCAISAQDLLAQCEIGQGQALIVADAAMLDLAGPHAHSESALRWMVGHIFQEFGDGTGQGARPEGEVVEIPEELTEVGASDHHHDRWEGGKSVQ